MNCPKCGHPLGKGRTLCRHCGARIIPPSNALRRQMAANGRVAMVCGVFMLLLAGVLFAYGNADLLWEAVLIILGLLLLFVGRKMT